MATFKLYGYGIVTNYSADDLHEIVVNVRDEGAADEEAKAYAEEEGGLFFPGYCAFENGEFAPRPHKVEAIRVWGYATYSAATGEGSDIKEKYFGHLQSAAAEEYERELDSDGFLCVDSEYCSVELA